MDKINSIIFYVGNIAPVLTVILLISIFYNYRSAMRLIHKRINHLYLLLDTLQGGICSPITRLAYNKIRPDIDLTQKDGEVIAREISFEHLNLIRENIIAQKKATDDPDIIKVHDEHLKEIEGMMNIMGTLDKNSSDEYIRQVMTDISASIERLITFRG